jgi:hypothetical protein
MFSVVGVGLSCWSAPTPSGSAGSPTSRPVQRLPRHGLAAGPRPLRAVDRRLFGQGIGASQQKWGDLPEAHTDFIFAVLGEELGLAGTLLVVLLFLTIAFAALRVARRTADPFVRYTSFGIVVWLVGQMIINVGMVLALLPVIGIPLPLISYGGSALLPSLIALGCWSASPAASRRPPGRWPSGASCARPAVAARRPLTPAHPTLSTDAHPPRRRRHRRPHLPLLATADALRRLEPAVRSPAWGTPGGWRTRVVPRRATPLELIPPVPLPRKPRIDLLPRAGAGCRGAVKEVPCTCIDRGPPDGVVVGYGGYVSMPGPTLAARARGAVVVHEQISLGPPGKPAPAPRLAQRRRVSSRNEARPAEYVGCRFRTMISGSTGGPAAEGAASSASSAEPAHAGGHGGSQGARNVNSASPGPPARSATPASRCCTWSARRTRSTAEQGARPTSCVATSTGWTTPSPPPT